MAHRIGALLTFVVIGLLALRLFWQHQAATLRRTATLMLALLLLQLGLGITNVVGHLPLGVAVAHNGVAALLLLTLITTLRISHHHA
jgi:cytochrome c oxidase assembly protein subunit 15